MVVVNRYLLKLFVIMYILTPSLYLISCQLTNSTRYGESRAAYREVQERQEDLKRVERTLAELAQLFSDVRSPHFFL